MTLENIGVFVDATPEGEKRIDYAAALAHPCDAHLAGIHVVSSYLRFARSIDPIASDWREADPGRARRAEGGRPGCDVRCSPALRCHIREARSPCRIPGEPSRWT
jgi:hypothetical protein